MNFDHWSTEAVYSRNIMNSICDFNDDDNDFENEKA
jgi:hypothetical protein